jgi:hypothetical protein
MQVQAYQYDAPIDSTYMAAPTHDQIAAFYARDAERVRVERAEAVGLPGITRGDDVEWDAAGVIRRGTFERVAAYGSRSRIAYLMVAVREIGGREIHLPSGSVRRAAAAALPECAAFVGAERRCGSCRIHRNVHA